MKEGGRIGGGEFREEEPSFDVNREFDVNRQVDVNRQGDEFNRDENVDVTGENGKSADVNVDRDGWDDTNFNVTGPDGRTSSATIDREGDGVANVQVHTAAGKTYDAGVVGPDGFRTGYIWRDGVYVPVNITPAIPYAVPFGPFLGWSIVTPPIFINYPVYATYPVETAVEVQLQQATPPAAAQRLFGLLRYAPKAKKARH